MGIRETLNQNQGITTAVSIGIIVIVLAIIILQMRGPGTPAAFRQAAFTVDDGESWFVDRIDRIPPFDHHGGQAVRARLYSCDGGETKFVGYMERFTPEAQQRLEGLRGTEEFGRNLFHEDGAIGVEMRRPQMPPDVWVNMDTHMAVAQRQMQAIRCPDGSDRVFPVSP